MTRTCPSCGTTSDDHARFCNRCGYPFPAVHPDNMTRVQRRDEPLYEEPVSAHRTTPRAPAAQQPERKKTSSGRPLPFKRFLIGNHLTIIYILGAVAIIAISLLGITAGFQATGTDSAMKSFSNTTALIVTPTASPLFWIAFLIFGSLCWRMFCEIAAIVYRMYEPATSGGDAPSYDETPVSDVAGSEELYECPHCGKEVPASELRECEHCGVQGCSHCIRMMGLVKKTMTCKDCFEKK